jgi:hypothetical protein
LLTISSRQVVKLFRLSHFSVGAFVAVRSLRLTFKIEKISGAAHLIIKLIGELNRESLPELEAQVGSASGKIEMEMREVTLVDVDVVRFLMSCEARDIPLRGCPLYIREWIRREQENE